MTYSVQPMPLHGPLFKGAIRVYGEAFAEPPYSDPLRGQEVSQRLRDLHHRRRGYRALVALSETGGVLGMAYGYCSETGQWWHDTVARRLAPEVAEDWLGDAYELVEIAVAPTSQGMGIGTELIHRLLDGIAQRTCVLSTRPDSTAPRLYEREGFMTVTEMLFTPNGAPFLIMGKRLR